MVYRSSSFWPAIKQFYFTILDYTSWTVGTYSFINLWNDNGVLSDGASIPDTVSQFWTGCGWNILLSLQQMPYFF